MATDQPVLDMTLQPKDQPPAALPATGDPALDMIQRACLDPAFDVAKLQALMDMREREMKRVAEQEFNRAMALAQAEMRPIATDATNPSTRSRYASYAALDRVLRPIYTKHGFGLSFDTVDGAPADYIRVVCYVTHAAGFSRTYRADMPADGKGARGGDVMTKTHAHGSAMSYGMRYLLKMIFNVAVGEDDDDGNGGRQQQERDIAAPPKFDDWYDDMDAMIVGGGNWDQFKEAWNPDAVKPFRDHLAKTNPAKIDEWKRKAKANGAPAKAAK